MAKNVEKSVMLVQSCCFANLNLLRMLSVPFSLPSPSSLLKPPNKTAAMLVFQTSPVGVELFLMQKLSFVPILKRFAWLAGHLIKKDN